MSDRGLKILKPDKTDITSTDPNDYIYWSKYPPLTFLEKKTVQIVVGSSCSLTNPITLSVPHDYDFIPLVMGTVRKTAGLPTGDVNNKYFMPAKDFAGIRCDTGLAQFLEFNFRAKLTEVEIRYNIKCIVPMVGYDCPLSNQTFDVDLYFHMWELGSVWPL